MAYWSVERHNFIVIDFGDFNINHKKVWETTPFQKTLCQSQGRDGKDIPKEVVEQIKKTIRKDKVTGTLHDVK